MILSDGGLTTKARRLDQAMDPPQSYRQAILDLLIGGYSTEEIAAALHLETQEVRAVASAIAKPVQQTSPPLASTESRVASGSRRHWV